MHFWKYQGTGNDFILIDNRLNHFDKSESTVKWLCDRRFGIGADGLICLESSDQADFKMVYFNSDGRESTFCGNGGRCVVAFAARLNLVQKNQQVRFMAKDGLHEAHWSENEISLKMQDVDAIHFGELGFELFTGSPHLVQLVPNAESVNVKSQGAALRNNPTYQKEGINVNFVERSGNFLSVRTYERGVEDETLSCGTGVTASALVASHHGFKSPVQVKTLGGNLEVSFETIGSNFTQIWLTGPAECVFEGSILLPSSQNFS